MFRIKKATIMGFIMIFILTLFTSGFSHSAYAATPVLSQPNLIADIAEKSSPMVVWIVTTYENKQSSLPPVLRRIFGEVDPTPAQGMGSGFFFNDKGYILTNAHVVEGASRIEVILKDQKNSIPAKLVGLDSELDIAVLKLDSSGKYPYLKLGDSDSSRIGEWVVAIGNPYGLDHTVTVGIISAKGRPLSVGNSSQEYEDMIQTDAAINPGNSGGPLLNLRGEVIGINTAVSATGQGLGFAIPSNAVKDILDELITHGKISRPWLGVALIDTKTLDSRTKNYLKIGNNEGVLIRPLKNSPAANAGLRQMDLLMEINHQKITTVEDVIKYIRNHTKVGDTISLLILRDGSPETYEVTLSEKP